MHTRPETFGRTDEPAKTRLDRGSRLVKVVSVEAHASLEAERITGAESGKLHRRETGDEFGDLDSLSRRDGDLWQRHR